MTEVRVDVSPDHPSVLCTALQALTLLIDIGLLQQ